MIVLFFGQPTSGKTTLANNFVSEMNYRSPFNDFIRVDGDEWRELSDNKDYTKEGRISNIKSAFTMAKFLDDQGFDIVLSFIAPYQELRDYLQKRRNVKMIYLNHLHLEEDRGRNMYFVDDFEQPVGEYLELNTSIYSIEECVDKCIEYYNLPLTIN